MSKHQGPWTIDEDTLQLYDADDIVIAMDITQDPETRAILLHALDMFETLKYWASQRDASWDWHDAIDSISEDVAKIEAEIAGKGTT